MLELLLAHRDLVAQLAPAGQDLAQLGARGVGCRCRCRAHHRAIAGDQPGIDPVAKDSGLRENRRVIKGGRGQVRRALYMAAVASLRIRASPLKQRYAQLVAKGKAPKLALTALMRKMLVTLNAMLKTRQAWKDQR